jgi:hypothetical protein
MSDVKCECGKILTDEEKETNEKIAKEAGTKKLNLCERCWISFCHHAITGD